MDERVSVTVDAGVADVRLNRADKMNALDAAMFDALIAAGERLAHEPGVRAVVLSGEGRAFCAGLDLGRFQRMAADGGDGSGRDPALRLGPRTRGACNDPQYAATLWRELPVPVIAAVHGVAFGGGLQIALGADLRFVAADARLSVMEIRWGLVPDMGGMLLMRSLLRGDVLRELVYGGRIVDGREAVALGLATRVCDDPRAEALAFAREIAGRNPDAVRAAKRLCLLADRADAAELLQAESDEQARLLGSPNQLEAVRAHLAARAPSFVDPPAGLSGG